LARRTEYDVRANWKLIFENYSECYHCPLVHPELSKLTPYDTAENDLFEGPFLARRRQPPVGFTTRLASITPG